MSDRQNPLPTPADVRRAAERLAGHAVETPLLRAGALDEQIGGRLLLKAEPLQRTGSFKFRGACNRLLQLDAGAKAGGVVAYSSGNHAQAVAAAAKLVGVSAVIVMPRDAPAVKIAGTRRHGAEVVLYDRASEAREGRSASASPRSVVRRWSSPMTTSMSSRGRGRWGTKSSGSAALLAAGPMPWSCPPAAAG